MCEVHDDDLNKSGDSQKEVNMFVVGGYERSEYVRGMNQSKEHKLRRLFSSMIGHGESKLVFGHHQELIKGIVLRETVKRDLVDKLLESMRTYLKVNGDCTGPVVYINGISESGKSTSLGVTAVEAWEKVIICTGCFRKAQKFKMEQHVAEAKSKGGPLKEESDQADDDQNDNLPYQILVVDNKGACRILRKHCGECGKVEYKFGGDEIYIEHLTVDTYTYSTFSLLGNEWKTDPLRYSHFIQTVIKADVHDMLKVAELDGDKNTQETAMGYLLDNFTSHCYLRTVALMDFEAEFNTSQAEDIYENGFIVFALSSGMRGAHRLARKTMRPTLKVTVPFWTFAELSLFNSKRLKECCQSCLEEVGKGLSYTPAILLDLLHQGLHIVHDKSVECAHFLYNVKELKMNAAYIYVKSIMEQSSLAKQAYAQPTVCKKLKRVSTGNYSEVPDALCCVDTKSAKGELRFLTDFYYIAFINYINQKPPTNVLTLLTTPVYLKRSRKFLPDTYGTIGGLYEQLFDRFLLYETSAVIEPIIYETPRSSERLRALAWDTYPCGEFIKKFVEILTREPAIPIKFDKNKYWYEQKTETQNKSNEKPFYFRLCQLYHLVGFTDTADFLVLCNLDDKSMPTKDKTDDYAILAVNSTISATGRIAFPGDTLLQHLLLEDESNEIFVAGKINRKYVRKVYFAWGIPSGLFWNREPASDSPIPKGATIIISPADVNNAFEDLDSPEEMLPFASSPDGNTLSQESLPSPYCDQTAYRLTTYIKSKDIPI